MTEDDLKEFLRRGQAAQAATDEMIADVVRRDLEAARKVFQSMRTKDLRILRAAFIADRQSDRAMNNKTGEAFCTGRLTTIDDVLQERGE